MKAFAFSTMSAMRTLAACGKTPVSVIHRNRVECRSAYLASPFDVRAIVINGDGELPLRQPRRRGGPVSALRDAAWLLVLLFALAWVHEWQARQEAELVALRKTDEAERMSGALAICLNGGIPLRTEDSKSVIVCNRAVEVKL